MYFVTLCLWITSFAYFFFFFQAEDGIRDRDVTGVQTCALPISFPQPRSAGLLRQRHDLPAFPQAIEIVRPNLHHLDALRPVFRRMHIRSTHAVLLLVSKLAFDCIGV